MLYWCPISSLSVDVDDFIDNWIKKLISDGNLWIYINIIWSQDICVVINTNFIERTSSCEQLISIIHDLLHVMTDLHYADLSDKILWFRKWKSEMIMSDLWQTDVGDLYIMCLLDMDPGHSLYCIRICEWRKFSGELCPIYSINPSGPWCGQRWPDSRTSFRQCTRTEHLYNQGFYMTRLCWKCCIIGTSLWLYVGLNNLERLENVNYY